MEKLTSSELARMIATSLIIKGLKYNICKSSLVETALAIGLSKQNLGYFLRKDKFIKELEKLHISIVDSKTDKRKKLFVMDFDAMGNTLKQIGK